MNKDKYGFRKLIKITDKNCRDELDEYYVISKSRMDNIIHCLESGVKEIDNLKEELTTEKEKCKDLEKENVDLTNGFRCADCQDTGLLENRVEGKFWKMGRR